MVVPGPIYLGSCGYVAPQIPKSKFSCSADVDVSTPYYWFYVLHLFLWCLDLLSYVSATANMKIPYSKTIAEGL